jgi:sialic acid synthase SpsE
VSAYPAPIEEMNLRAMSTLRDRFGCPVGLSDHTLGIAIALAAVARGATIVEKHLTLDKAMPGPDHRASLEPREFAELVRGIRAIEASLGDGDKRPMPCEADVRRVARKSLVAARVPARRRNADLGRGRDQASRDRDSALGPRRRARVPYPSRTYGDEVLDWAMLETR